MKLPVFTEKTPYGKDARRGSFAQTAGRVLTNKVFRRILFASAGTLILLLCVWFAAPYLTDDPMPEIKKHTPCMRFISSGGQCFYTGRTFDHEIRLTMPLAAMPEHLLRIALAAEDSHFYEHSGVYYPSVFRAAWQNITNGRVVSGASTITMQLAAMAHPRGRRGIWGKLVQSAAARKLEMLYSKERILEEYLNRIPCGGKIYGVSAAAEYYFGMPAEDLNFTECALICGLPQSPNRFRPDRHPAAAAERMRTVMKLLVLRGLVTREKADSILKNERLRFRTFANGNPFANRPDPSFHYAVRALAERRETEQQEYDLKCRIDSLLQTKIIEILKRNVASIPEASDAAAVLLDTETGSVLALAGTLDFSSPDSGQVDASRAVRCAGSALKPFIYAEAVDGGLITASTVLDDSPVRFGDYAPENFDGEYHGRVTAADALARSLNIPAIMLMRRLGEKRVVSIFEKMKILREKRKRELGLSLALGSAGFDLFSLANAYRMLARGGVHAGCAFLVDTPDNRNEKRIFSKGVSRLITEMLEGHDLPHTALRPAWKTGTSNNNRDAWCFAYDKNYTLGIWVGRKDGAPVKGLSGLSSAAPAAGEIFDMLYSLRGGSPSQNGSDGLFEETSLCSVSGLSVSPACKSAVKGRTVRDIPLSVCGECTSIRGGKIPLAILSPTAAEYILPPGGGITLSASRENVHWYADGEYIGDQATAAKHVFSPGRHRLTAFDTSDMSSADVVFSVTPPKGGVVSAPASAR